MKYKLLLIAFACFHTALHAQSKPSRELYNLQDDLGETKEVSGTNAEVVTRLTALMKKYLT